MELNKHIYKVMKWLDDPKSVSKDELVKNRDAAYAAHAAHATYVTYDVYVAAAYAAAASYAENWVNEYFKRTGEDKQDYLDAIEGEK